MVKAAINIEPKKNSSSLLIVTITPNEKQINSKPIENRCTTAKSVLQNLSSAIGDQQDQSHKKQNHSQGTVECGSKNFTPVLPVDFSPGYKFSLVLRLESLLAVPPGAAAIEIISNVRGTDDRHVSPLS